MLKVHKMLDEVYKQIGCLTDRQDMPLANTVCKLSEEVLELIQSVNKHIGMKKHNQTQKEIDAEILEESADVIQNVLCIMYQRGIKPDDVIAHIKKKNLKWERRIVSQGK